MRPLAVRGRWLLGCLLLALVACAKDDTGISDPEERFLLFQLNAGDNDGRTVRWPDSNLPIPTFLGGVARPDEVTEWTTVSEGRVRFAFVDSPPAEGITFREASLDRSVCGVSNIEFEDDRIRRADVRLNPRTYRGSGCVRTVTHEAGHAIGILSHTSDGGLMDADGGDGDITGDVAEMVRNLYSLQPGTRVGILEGKKATPRRAGKRHTITIIDYAKP